MDGLTGVTGYEGFIGTGWLELAMLAVAVLLAGYPIWRVLHRMGWGHGSTIGWLIAFSLPVVSIFAWWYLAFTAWPRDDLA